MKKMILKMVLLFVFVLTFFKVFGGTDAKDCRLTIQPTVVNGTNAFQVTAYYPTNWTSRSFQISSDITSSNNWRGVTLAEQVSPKVNSPGGQLPAWSMWTVSSQGVIGPRFFRLVKQ